MISEQFRIWRLLITGFLNAFENMAIDEAILKACSIGKSPPTIRVYGWRPHAISLGYSQKIKDTINREACERLEVDIVRRPTGGRAVLHDEESTYSLISPIDNPLFPPNILGSYQKISSCLIWVFKRLGIEAQMVIPKEEIKSPFERRVDPICFLSPSWYEITVNSRKICGSAQRRSDAAFLQHGSILLKFDPMKLTEILSFKEGNRTEIIDYLRTKITSVNEQLSRSIGFFEFNEMLTEGFKQGLDLELKEGELSPEEHRLKKEYLEKRYLNPSWNYR
ncbi:MAG: lipoate--protein ligase family protein [Thermodesulfobacteriota bacterium]|nr:lipoate--protein ligase family protein [Thermodesulfobacteriota bacterium]